MEEAEVSETGKQEPEATEPEAAAPDAAVETAEDPGALTEEELPRAIEAVLFCAGEPDARTLQLLGVADSSTSAADDEAVQLASRTLGHYQTNAERFREGTQDHDVSQNIDALLRHIQAPAPWQILDLGCGPGRDLRTFRALGHNAVGLDGAEAFVQMAREASGCEVWHQDFLALDLPAARFDGVFANATVESNTPTSVGCRRRCARRRPRRRRLCPRS